MSEQYIIEIITRLKLEPNFSLSKRRRSDRKVAEKYLLGEDTGGGAVTRRRISLYCVCVWISSETALCTRVIGIYLAYSQFRRAKNSTCLGSPGM